VCQCVEDALGEKAQQGPARKVVRLRHGTWPERFQNPRLKAQQSRPTDGRLDRAVVDPGAKGKATRFLHVACVPSSDRTLADAHRPSGRGDCPEIRMKRRTGRDRGRKRCIGADGRLRANYILLRLKLLNHDAGALPLDRHAAWWSRSPGVKHGCRALPETWPKFSVGIPTA